MKLRNKKTGVVFNFVIKAEQDYTASYFILKTGSGGWEDGLTYGTLEELHKEWEDYKPAEPLITDEKIRKAVRTWASENLIEQVEFEYIAGTGSIFKDGIGGVSIGFYDDLKLIVRETYAIAELCGEEEE